MATVQPGFSGEFQSGAEGIGSGSELDFSESLPGFSLGFMVEGGGGGYSRF